MTLNNLAFRVKFYEGLPTSVYEWAVTHQQAYTADFGSALTQVRDHMVLERAVEGHAYSAVIPTASGKQQGSGLGCYHSGGGHYVKQCPMNPLLRGLLLRRPLQRRRSDFSTVEAQSTW